MKHNTRVIPATVSREYEQKYVENYNIVTKQTHKLFMFSADQKIEHLNKDFYDPKKLDPSINDPEHIFKIAQAGYIGALNNHLGLIARYGRDYPTIPYIVKLNAKSNLVALDQSDPVSAPLYSVDDVVNFSQQSGLIIPGISVTIYLGSRYEAEMLTHAAQSIYQAHKYGLLAIVFVYPRGTSVAHPQDPLLTAGAAGLGVALGADFVKIQVPKIETSQDTLAGTHMSLSHWLSIASQAAGKTGVICAGGSKKDSQQYIQELYDQLHVGNMRGCALGRNIFQRPLNQAINFTHAVSKIVYENSSVQEALDLL